MNKYAGMAAEALAGLTSQRGFQVPPISSVSRRAAVENQLYIFNVNPKSFQQHMGTLGYRYIPACMPGQRVSEPCIIPGIIFEAVYVGAMGDGAFENREHDGVLHALDVMGLGAHQAPENALTRYGVFLADGSVPTEDEIARAEANLRRKREEDLAEGDAEYAINQGMRTITTREGQKNVSALKSQHYEAAAALGVKRPWLSRNDNSPEAALLVSCENCGVPNEAIRAKCKDCGAIINEERARKLFPGDFSAAKRGRPANEEVAA